MQSEEKLKEKHNFKTIFLFYNLQYNFTNRIFRIKCKNGGMNYALFVHIRGIRGKSLCSR